MAKVSQKVQDLADANGLDPAFLLQLFTIVGPLIEKLITLILARRQQQGMKAGEAGACPCPDDCNEHLEAACKSLESA